MPAFFRRAFCTSSAASLHATSHFCLWSFTFKRKCDVLPHTVRRWGVDIKDRHPAFLVELDPRGCWFSGMEWWVSIVKNHRFFDICYQSTTLYVSTSICSLCRFVARYLRFGDLWLKFCLLEVAMSSSIKRLRSSRIFVLRQSEFHWMIRFLQLHLASDLSILVVCDVAFWICSILALALPWWDLHISLLRISASLQVPRPPRWLALLLLPMLLLLGLLLFWELHMYSMLLPCLKLCLSTFSHSSTCYLAALFTRVAHFLATCYRTWPRYDSYFNLRFAVVACCILCNWYRRCYSFFLNIIIKLLSTEPLRLFLTTSADLATLFCCVASCIKIHCCAGESLA